MRFETLAIFGILAWGAVQFSRRSNRSIYTTDIHGVPLSTFQAGDPVTMPDGQVWTADGQGGFGYFVKSGEEPVDYDTSL